MFAMASDPALSLSFSMESSMSMKHPFGISPEVKPHRQTVLLEDNRMSIDTPSPRPPPVRGDNETVRKKLRESLISALEMVVGKQVVKSVLGVGEVDLKVDVNEEKPQPPPEESNPEGETANQGTLSFEIDHSEEDGVKAERTDTRTHVVAPATNESEQESEESPSKKLKSGKEDGSPSTEETKGGLHLMEQVKKVAWDIELHLFSFYGGVNKKYKEKARSLLFNLKDKSNPELRARVFTGEITPHVLVRMSGEQLASKELSQWRTAKAEAFASMVVLTDADVDPRRIVKKTHKGEFQVMKESDISPSVDAIESRTSFPVVPKKSPEGGKKAASPDGGKKGQGMTRNASKSPPSVAVEQRDKSPEAGDEVDALGDDLPTIMSLAEYIDTREDVPLDESESLPSEAQATSKSVKEAPKLRTPTGSPSIVPESSFPKPVKGSGSTNGGLGVAGFVSKKRHREVAGLVWEGSVQLSATRFAPVDGIFKSGEMLELKDWPKSVEVKGRVRLVALDKFLQDLQLSRSRTVTVLSLCPSDRQGTDLKQVRAYLNEMADQYRMGDRAGFVEPAPGFELYLLAPGCASLDFLGELKTASNPALARDDEILVGVVVWRKTPGAPSSADQNGSLKKVTLSSQVSESPTKVNATPMHWKETPSSGGALPTPLKTAPAYVNVSGNSSMHSTRGDSSATRDTSTRRVWPTASGLRLSPVGVPSMRVSENAHAAMPDSLSLPHQSVELEDVPPGFLPRALHPLPQCRPAGVDVESKERIPAFQPPFVSSASGPASHVPDRSRENTDVPPGFWPRPPNKAAPATSQRNNIASLDDDDDLPEFNFEAEGVIVPQTAANHLPAQPQFLMPQNPSSSSSQPPSTSHSSDPSSSRYQGHMNGLERHPTSMQPQPSPPVLPASRHAPQQEEPYNRLPHHAPSLEGWKTSEVRIRETVQQSLHQEVPRPLPPLSAPDPRSLPVRGAREEAVSREEDFRHFAHDSQRGSGAGAPGGTYGFQASRAAFGAVGAAGPLAPRSELPEWCPPPPAIVQQPVQRASFATSLHLRQQQAPSPVHLAVQQQHHAVLKANSLPTWVRVPLPQQDTTTRYDYRQAAVSTSGANKWQPNNSHVQHSSSRSMHPPRKVESRESSYDKERSSVERRDSDRRRGGRDRRRVRERSRERSLSPTPERERDRGGYDRRISRSRSPTPLKNQSPQRRSKSHSVERKDTKPPKRERERDQ